MKANDIIIYFALKYNGDWDAIYEAIKAKEAFDGDLFEKMKERCHAKWLTILDEDYPQKLKDAFKPPFALFYFGNIELLKEEKTAAVIGSRKATEYGKMATEKLVNQFVDNGVVVLSGLALGIDAVAHDVACQKMGKTIAVLGSGIEKCYPITNSKIYERMCKEQLVLSEYPLDTEPKKENFPIRNRLIAALSDVIVVTESYAKSGTLITVNLGLQMNKDIYCVPYPLDAHSQNNRLIKDGAGLIENYDDIDF